MAKLTKRQQLAREKIDGSRNYPVKEAFSLPQFIRDFPRVTFHF